MPTGRIPRLEATVGSLEGQRQKAKGKGLAFHNELRAVNMVLRTAKLWLASVCMHLSVHVYMHVGRGMKLSLSEG